MSSRWTKDSRDQQTSQYGEARLWTPGKRTRRGCIVLLVSALIALTVLGSVAHLLPGIASFIGSLSPTPSHSSRASTSSPPTPNCQPAPPPVNGIITATAPICNGPPQTPVPDLSLPTTVFSNIDSKVGEGGVIRYSADNLTLYNLG